MPAIQPADSPFRSHHWHTRQSDLSMTSTDNNTLTIIIVVVVVVVVVIVLVAGVYSCAKRTSSHVAPRSMVQAPPGSQRGPVIAEMLANDQAGAVERDETTRDMPATVSSSAPIHAQDPSQAMDEHSQPLLSVDENDRGSRTSLGPGVGQVDEPPRTVIIHEDGGPVARVDTSSPIELPPPYASVPLA